jgi:hypothetical protein
LALLTDKGVIVPDLVPRTDDAPLPNAVPPEPSTVAAALTACGEVAHRGLDHLSPTMRTHLRDAADDLRRAGLRATADRVATLADEVSVDSWLRAQLRLLTLVELAPPGRDRS